ncbi:MAG: hypothetical protein Q9N34_03490 [Aquificota bacterium]|nr:hypothetical protein [Aquificota bacterium]
MPKSRWLADEYIKEKLEMVLSMRGRVKLEDFKILFMIPVDDSRILDLAKECGFKVSKANRGIVIELRKKA